MIKPDGVQRRLVGRILNRYEEKGLQIVGLKLISMTEAQAKDLYSVHEGRPFYESLVKFITSGPVLVMAVQGAYAIPVVRKLLGATFGYEADPGSIRGDFGNGSRRHTRIRDRLRTCADRSKYIPSSAMRLAPV